MEVNDMKFDIYSERYVYLGGEIRNGELELISEVYGDYDSEKHYYLSRSETEKLFSGCTLDEFIDLCQKGRLIGMEAYLNKRGIRYRTAGI